MGVILSEKCSRHKAPPRFGDQMLDRLRDSLNFKNLKIAVGSPTPQLGVELLPKRQTKAEIFPQPYC